MDGYIGEKISLMFVILICMTSVDPFLDLKKSEIIKNENFRNILFQSKTNDVLFYRIMIVLFFSKSFFFIKSLFI